MGRKRKSEAFEKETTPAIKVAASPESRRSARVQAKKGTTPVMVLVDYADGEKKQTPNESETGTNVEKGSLEAPIEGSPSNTELAADETTTVEKLNSAVQRIKELKFKADVSPDADDICYKSLYENAKLKVEELMAENISLNEKWSFEKGAVSVYKNSIDNLTNLLKDAICNVRQATETPTETQTLTETPTETPTETQTPKRKYTKKGNDNSSLGEANETQPSQQQRKKTTKKGNDKSTPGKANET